MKTTNYKIEAAAPANVRPSSVSKTRAFGAHTANRELSTQSILGLLKAQLPQQFELAEIVGRWIRLDFPARRLRLWKARKQFSQNSESAPNPSRRFW
jgi:hypothetical protein